MLSYILKKYFKYRFFNIEKEALHYESAQKALLQKILICNRNTRYFAKYNITDCGSFFRNCPLVTYDDIERHILNIKEGKNNVLSNQTIRAFAKSSGTTSQSKFIPYSMDSIEYNFKAGKDMLALYLHSFPRSKIISGKNFSLTGSYGIENGFVVGDVSSLFAYFLKPWYKPFRSPNLFIATMPDWEKKLEQLCIVLSKEDIRWIAGVPSWIKLVIEAIENYTQRPIRTVWKNLEVFFYGGVNIDPFRSYFDLKFNRELILWQTYNASEGFFGLQYNKDENDLLLLPNNGNYYEFIPISAIDEINPLPIPVQDVIVGEKYELIITNLSGLYRYRMGDIVKITNILPLKIELMGRTKSFINMFGEELMVHNAEKAVLYIHRETSLKIVEYTVAPILRDDGKGVHNWMIEFETEPKDIKELELMLDSHLRMLNSDYNAKRERDFILANLKIEIISKGSFQKWLEGNNKLNVQSKIPKLWNDTSIQNQIRTA